MKKIHLGPVCIVSLAVVTARSGRNANSSSKLYGYGIFHGKGQNDGIHIPRQDLENESDIILKVFV